MPERVAESGGSAVARWIQGRGPGGRPFRTAAAATASQSATSRCNDTALPFEGSGGSTVYLRERVGHHQQRIADPQLDVANPSVVHHVRLALHRGLEHLSDTTRLLLASR